MLLNYLKFSIIVGSFVIKELTPPNILPNGKHPPLSSSLNLIL